MTADPSDRFGIPDQRIIDVIRAHAGIWRDGCYVPTRAEVAGGPAELLWAWLLGWWHESPTELIPTDAQVAEVVAILRARPDAATPQIQPLSRKRRRLRKAGRGDGAGERRLNRTRQAKWLSGRMKESARDHRARPSRALRQEVQI